MDTREFSIAMERPCCAGGLALAAALLLSSCGGSQAASEGTKTPGQSHANSGAGSSSNGGAGDDGGDDLESQIPSDRSPDATPTSVDPANSSEASPVTFVLTNSASDELYLNMDKGWQAVIYAYSGTPPNAKSMLMFPTHCTAACDAAAEDLCPVCPEPQRVKDIQAAENHDDVAPGDSREVPWDGLAFAYSKTRKGRRDGRRAICNCFDMADPEPGTYTIKACGLRKTQSAKVRSRYQCAVASLTLPVTQPVRVQLDFGDE